MLNESRILVVDDTPANLEIASEVLNNAGYTVATVLDSNRAFKRLQTYLPDLILLDVQMPGLNGFEMCQQLKANPATAAIPIIFMTALADTDSKVYGLSLGAVDYITKPFQAAELLARVNTHLQLHQLTKHLEERVQERTAELEAALHQLAHSQLNLIQHEKMASLGGLVAGVAHEVNNPVGFLRGSIDNGKHYINELLTHLSLYQKHYPNPVSEIQGHAENIDLEFVSEDLPKLLDSMERATDRIASISTSLRTFSRADTEYKVRANLHDGIDSTLLILKYRLQATEYRPAIQVTQNYGEIPEIECFPGQLNQVFMNILANAIDMFDEMADKATFNDFKINPQEITIQTTMQEPSTIEIRIQDNGKGMDEEIQSRIFDHLFTTKGVGKGTGLGLAIARQIIEEKHGGHLSLESTLGKGSTFIIQL
ncbi:hybrid sensor histidine kinase/response regulator [Alkalinema sp. FACHB-956]|uniref:hybrid sensor histidine kinase/response regulator n=1 Tax=Alkalinema sp. FACHB-956 TaxID=2692768 RepID=UPI0016893850|nr:hybrid sensor histidine kinase/response regulator [Alkalinema sp. FACHB-956]MBD2329847.1 hybrid sensor histidine kinase/response regulator [Alkalinema sp. FACHB-956]